MGALSATPNPKYQKPFLPLLPGFQTVPFNEIASIDAITQDTCAVIIEPIQGEGGIHPSKVDFLRKLRAKCDQVGALLIFDEIQVSFSSFLPIVWCWKDRKVVWISIVL